MKKWIIGWIGILIFQVIEIQSQTVRKYSNEFLKIGVGGKYQGLGGSLVASKEDPTSVFYNPASISTHENISASLMHSSYFAGIANYDYGGLILPIKNEQTLGVSLIRMGIDDIPNTIELYNPDGTINYDKVTSFSISDMALFLTYAKKIGKIEGLSVGLNAKIINRSYGTFATGWGFGADIGAQYVTDKFHVGCMIQDATTTFSTWKFSFTEREKEVFAATNNTIPASSVEISLPSIHLGGTYIFSLAKGNFSIAPSAKFTIFTEQRNVLLDMSPVSIDGAFGTEFGIYKTAYLRLGVNNFTRPTDDLGNKYLSLMPSLGLGVKLQQFDLDYSYNNVANAGFGLYSHVFSFNVRFKKKST